MMREEMNKELSLHQDERGSVSIVLLISMITLVCLIALIFNTAHQTSRRDQMQGAADAAAIGGGTMAGRGLNDIAANNNRMAEMLALMIATRSTLQAAEIMAKLLPAEAALYKLWPPTAWIGTELDREAVAFGVLATDLKVADAALTHAGWPIMTMWDWMNVFTKGLTPGRTLEKSRHLAKLNGANREAGAALIPGEGWGGDSVLVLPVARGLKEELVDRVENCQIKPLAELGKGLLKVTGPLASVAVFPRASDVFDKAVGYNFGNLRGSQEARAVSSAASGLAAPLLEWPSVPPQPMLLTDAPPINPFGTMETKESEADLQKVRKYLQYLAIATGNMSRKSWIGGDNFPNIAPQQSLTYAEADIYNPTYWSMWAQDWRVKLASSAVLNDKPEQVLRKIGIFGPSARAMEIVNTH
jgi:hypothetical protein